MSQNFIFSHLTVGILLISRVLPADSDAGMSSSGSRRDSLPAYKVSATISGFVVAVQSAMSSQRVDHHLPDVGGRIAGAV